MFTTPRPTVALVMMCILSSWGSLSPRPAAAQSATGAGNSPPTVNAALIYRMQTASPDGAPSQRYAPLLETEISIRVTGPIVRGVVRQRFENPTDDWIEGIYVFPLPDLAAVDTLRMNVGDRVIEGVIEEKEAAKKRYAKASAEGKRASLVEQERPNMFTTSVANIGPGDIVEIEIEWQEMLEWDDGRYRLTLPTVVAPRYVPGSGIDRAEAARVTPPILSPLPSTRIPPLYQPVFYDPSGGYGPLADPTASPAGTEGATGERPIRIEITLDAGFDLARVESPSHDITVTTLGGDRDSRLIIVSGQADRDFVLEWEPVRGEALDVAVFSETVGRDQYVLMMVVPPAAAPARGTLTREMVLVIDTSGSMGGTSIIQARAALDFALARLDPTDYFNVIEFASGHRMFSQTSVAANQRNVAAARHWVAGLEAGGGTEMMSALDAALVDLGLDVDVRQIVFVTDGAIANDSELLGRAERALGRSRLFPVGIGSAPNAYLLDRLAKLGRGTTVTITSPNEINRQMSSLFSKLEAPVLAGLDVHWNDVVEQWPARLPDLYAGEPIVVSAKLSRFVGEVTFTGQRGDTPFEMTLPLVRGETRAGVAKLWARRKIADWLSLGLSGAPPDRVRSEIVAVALEHGLVSKFTSLVAVERTPVRPRSEAQLTAAVPGALPADWDPSMIPGLLPRTGTRAQMSALLGMMFLMVAGVLMAIRRRSLWA